MESTQQEALEILMGLTAQGMVSQDQMRALIVALQTQAQAISEQTMAITALADSNMALVAAMLEGEGDPEAQPLTYLNGQPIG